MSMTCRRCGGPASAERIETTDAYGAYDAFLVRCPACEGTPRRPPDPEADTPAVVEARP